MVEQDTIKLLRECDAGVKMGIDSIEDVTENVENSEFERVKKIFWINSNC